MPPPLHGRSKVGLAGRGGGCDDAETAARCSVRVRRLYRARIVATATGECSRCWAIAGDPAEGEDYAALAR